MKVKVKKFNPDGYVSRAAFEQIRWEKDVAMQQLEELGVPFGAKVELYAKPIVHAHWRKIEPTKNFEAGARCSHCEVCAGYWDEVIEEFDFCPFCGAKMDEVIE